MRTSLFVAAALVSTLAAADGQYAAAGEIPIGGLGRFDYLTVDSAAKRLYVSHGTEVVVIDTATNKVVGKIADTPGVHGIVIANWKVAPAEEPTGMAIDTTRHRIFVGGGPNQVMLDGATGKVVGSAKICDGTDATFFDASASMSMSSCSDGHITIIKIGPGDTMTVAQTLTTTRGARTMALDPATHKIYTAAQNFASATAGAKPTAVPDSFHVLVYAPAK